MVYSYKFRIYPTPEQETQIQKTFGCCRYVYNYFLAERIKATRKREKAQRQINRWANSLG